MPHNYKCPKCDNEWSYQGDTSTTFRDGGVQHWDKTKSERIDTCTCGTLGTYVALPLNEKKVAVSFTDSGTGKTYTK